MRDLTELEALVQNGLDEARLNRWYYQRFQTDNPLLWAQMEPYLDGGPRPSDADLQIGVNHYGTSLVRFADALGWLREPLPFIPA